MKAILVTKYGSPEGLQLKEVNKPTPNSDEILVRIHATTVTIGDVFLRSMRFPVRMVFGLFFNMRKNKILGHELAGVVEETGSGVTRFRKDDHIFASAGNRGGAYAEYICLPEDGMVAVKPTDMIFIEAAAVPIGGNTALHILKEGNIQRGQKVLIYGASGSVGTYGVQLAKYYYGAEVTGVCSTTNLEMVKSIGADQVIDYTQEDFTQSGEKFDVIFDAVRKISSSSVKRSLKENGTFLSSSSSTSESTENLILLKELFEAGNLKAVIDRIYPLEQIVEAHRYVEKGHKKGNVVITVIPDDNN